MAQQNKQQCQIELHVVAAMLHCHKQATRFATVSIREFRLDILQYN
jgi:hypothetical protein